MHQKYVVMKRMSIMSFLFLMLSACNSDHFSETPMDQFKGTWELRGRKDFNGIRIKIDTKNGKKFKGRIVELNDNKMVRLFVDSNDVWVSSIDRLSNFEFELTEKKVAHQLFGMYDLPTKQVYSVKFVNEDRFELDGDDDVYYQRVK